uniref:MPP n=1 Tax=Oscarella lobularis TaxID=121494 RepID=A0A2P1GIX2_OSCLO|nr:MPP [Oscarella lobularis]
MASSSVDRRTEKTLSMAGIERLLGSLEHIRTKMGSERDDDFKFLSVMLQSSDFHNLVEVHRRVTATDDALRSTVHHENVEDLLHEVVETLNDAAPNSEHAELLSVLDQSYFRQLCAAYGRVVRKEFPVPSDEPEDEADACGEKLVKIQKKRGQILGATIRVNDKTRDVFVSRVLHGSLAYGKLRAGDLLLELNGERLRGKTVDDVAAMLGRTGSEVTFKINRSDYDVSLTSEVYVKTHFAYDPMADTLNPCPEAGLKFEKSDILKIVNQEDPKWWQAVLVDQEGRAGLIPSKQLKERQMSLCVSNANDIAEKRYVSRKVSWWRICTRGERRKSLYSVADDYASEIMTYEEVAQFRPDLGTCRPIILIGPIGVGRSTITKYLIENNPDLFVGPIPTTTRPRKSLEVNGQDYTFISKTRMEDGIFNNQFIEYGEHKGHYYGTSLAAIRDVVKKGKVCILAVNPKALRTLKGSDLKPFVAFIKPPSFERLRETRREKGSDSRSDDEFWKMLQSSKRITDRYANYFDVIVVNDDVKKACHQLKRHAENIRVQPQWIPKQWLE